MTCTAAVSQAQACAATVRWLERAVIGLNLCPFAKVVHIKRHIHFATYLSHHADGLIKALLFEAAELVARAPSDRDTTLLIAPNTLQDFLDFNDLSARTERRLKRAGFHGVLQLASFHPQFQFADSVADDIANATNRAPYPTLHLLREDSVSRAVEAFPDAHTLFQRNIEVLRRLGAEGWAALGVGPDAP